jgi:hypothetical protein
VANEVISMIQSTFIKVRFILDDVVVLHEFLITFIKKNLVYFLNLILKKHMTKSTKILCFQC